MPRLPLLLLLLLPPAALSAPPPAGAPDAAPQADAPGGEDSDPDAMLAVIAAPPAQPARAAYLSWAAGLQPEPHPEAGYRFLDELHAELAPVVAAMPGRVEPLLLGRSVRGAPIWAFRCADPMVVPGAPPPRKMLVFGAIHPLEWVGTEVVVEALRACAHRPVPGVELTFIPVLNVDGRRVVEGDLLEGRDRYRRTNAAGVDLNRDYSVHRDSRAVWRHLIPDRYSTSPAPLSQPESQALDALAAAERFDVALSLHTFGGYIYTPWAGHWERPPDRAELVGLGHLMEHAQTGRPYRTQQLSHWAFFFRGCGMELDHLYASYGTKAFLIELTRSGVSPFAPWTWGEDFRLYNPADPTPDVEGATRAVGALARHLGGQPQPHAAPVSPPTPPVLPTAAMPWAGVQRVLPRRPARPAAEPTPQ
jgi:hypothetical protein